VEFISLRVQVFHLVDQYVLQLKEKHGSYMDWRRYVGEPLIHIFFSEDELKELLARGNEHVVGFWWARRNALFRWADITVTINDKQILEARTLCYQVVAIRKVYEEENWRSVGSL